MLFDCVHVIKEGINLIIVNNEELMIRNKSTNNCCLFVVREGNRINCTKGNKLYKI